MFEGKILQTGKFEAAAEGVSAEESLHVLSWDELIARLGAAHDFRRLIETGAEVRAGSFNASSARHLAALGDEQPGINPFALTNGKMRNSMGFVARETAVDDRESQ